ncbi:hypothetical protein L5B71_00935 [Avibacterium sp. 21-586]|uniref:hypothetical protein n=1 Tax=Avibacterium sp. 21-586 TaxID=2911534 RepID=UPI002245B911|nr:hypothetical protein [Avibacterium sp. 21-586]MCW9709459.1 hypothetical protein [Avibacterium sp. 21-586]
MNKFIKIGVVTLFALFLAACNKADPKADYAKLAEWMQLNQVDQASFQTQYNQKISTGDTTQLKEAMVALVERNTKLIKSLKAINIKDPEIQKLQDKTIEVLTYSSDLTESVINLANNPSPSNEVVKSLQEKTQKAQLLTADLQRMRAELAAKYANTH